MDRVISEFAVLNTLTGCGFDASLADASSEDLKAVFEKRIRAPRLKHVDPDGDIWEEYTHGWIAELCVRWDRRGGRALVLTAQSAEEFTVLDREGYVAFDRYLRRLAVTNG